MGGKYLLHGKLSAKEGEANALASILLEAAQLMSGATGCQLYAVGKDENHPNDVYVTEVWDSRDAHATSLQIDGVSALIARAIPLLATPPQKGQEITVLGGHGIC